MLNNGCLTTNFRGQDFGHVSAGMFFAPKIYEAVPISR
jgi:hypothetical protein